MSVHTCQLLMSGYVYTYICIHVHLYISRDVYLYNVSCLCLVCCFSCWLACRCPACVACVCSAVFHGAGMQVHVGACIIVCVCFLLFLVLSVHTWQLLVSVYVYVCPVLCFLFFVRGCLLVDASVVCVLKMLLFLLLLFCFFMCVPISIWSCVHICGWDRVVLGVCMFGAGADIQLVASGC